MENEVETAEEIFEKRFGEYLELEAHDKAEAALFEIVREAYKAGWKAAEDVFSAGGKFKLMWTVN